MVYHFIICFQMILCKYYMACLGWQYFWKLTILLSPHQACNIHFIILKKEWQQMLVFLPKNNKRKKEHASVINKCFNIIMKFSVCYLLSDDCAVFCVLSDEISSTSTSGTVLLLFYTALILRDCITRQHNYHMCNIWFLVSYDDLL